VSENDLRGSTPIFTAKDVLIEVRDEVRAMTKSVDILVSQNLNERVQSLETSRDENRGLARIAIVIAALAGVATIVVAIAGPVGG
jgi:hypothetical protein